MNDLISNFTMPQFGLRFIKKLSYMIFIGLIFHSCNSNVHKKTVLGSWYHFNTTNNEYHEVHIDDSLFIYIYDDANIVLPFDYKLINDSIYLGNSKKPIIRKFKISHSKFRVDKVVLKDESETLIFIKLDTTIQNLHYSFMSNDSLESFSYEYFKRKNRYLDEYE